MNRIREDILFLARVDGCRCLLLLSLGFYFALLVFVLFDQHGQFLVFEHANGGLVALFIAFENGDFDLVGRQFRRVQRLAEHSNGQTERVIQLRFADFVLLLQNRDGRLRVVSDAGRLPTAVVATGIGLIQLIAVVFVPAHVEKRDTERTLAAELRVGLFNVAQVRDDILDGRRFLVGQLVSAERERETQLRVQLDSLLPLTDHAQFIDQHVRITGDAGHGTAQVIVDLVDLLGIFHIVQ